MFNSSATVAFHRNVDWSWTKTPIYADISADELRRFFKETGIGASQSINQSINQDF